MFTGSSRYDVHIEKFFSFYAVVTGLYPLPAWFFEKPFVLKSLWRGAFIFAEFLILCMPVTALLDLFKGPQDKGHRTECAGVIFTYMTMGLKPYLLYRNLDLFERTISRLNSVGSHLYNNPIGNVDYPASQEKFVRPMIDYCRHRLLITALLMTFVSVFMCIFGLLADDVEHRLPPMPGWVPFPFDKNWLFTLWCIAVNLGYVTFAIRENYVDIVLMSTLKIIHHDLRYLKELLEDIVSGEDAEINSKNLKWWIKQHQDLIRTLKDCGVVYRPWLVVSYLYTSAVFFSIMWRLTDGSELDLLRQTGIIIYACTGFVHLFVISKIGDGILKDNHRICRAIMKPQAWNNPTSFQKLAIPILMRCNVNLSVRFADNRILCVQSFFDIMTKMSGYFVTVYQLRQ